MGNCNAKVKEVPDIGAGPPSELALMKKMELKRVLEADGIKRQDGDAWYVVEAAWVQRWLAFIQGDDASKKPGPIRNETLLCHNTETKTWGPKPLLRAARREHMGHYRRVNEHVWSLWVGCYAGSGPALWVDKPPFEDSSNWILDPTFRGGKGGGGDQARQSGEGSVPPERLWPSSTPNSLAIGDMEDDGVGEENAAKVAAFFDVVLDSPRVSHGAAAAAAALAAGTAAAAAPGGNNGNKSNGSGNGSGNDSGSGNGGGRLGNGSGNVSGNRSGNGSGNVNRSSHRSSNRSSSNRSSSNRSSSNRSSGNRSGNSNAHGSGGSNDGRRKGATEEEGTESRVSSTAKQWMYGGGEGGSME